MMLFELIQVAIGKRTSLSHNPTAEEWGRLYADAMKQSVAGVVFEGVQKLHKEQCPPQKLLFQWLGISEQIKQRNALLDKRCGELIDLMTSAGLHPTILKGQGIARSYLDSLQKCRQSGDIDVYVSDGYEKSIAFAKSQGQKDISWDYKHLHLKVWKDTEIELHYHVEVLLNLWKNKKLQKWFKQNENLMYEERDGMIMPTFSFNLFYVLLHIYRHFLYEGVGMRQLMDYYFVLMRADGHFEEYNDGKTIRDVLEMFGMYRFARGVSWVMQEVFAIEDKYLYCEPLESEGRFILDQIMIGGNFGHYDKRLKQGKGKWNAVKAVWHHNLHLMSHYPTEILSVPIWFVWHKCWKWTR